MFMYTHNPIHVLLHVPRFLFSIPRRALTSLTPSHTYSGFKTKTYYATQSATVRVDHPRHMSKCGIQKKKKNHAHFISLGGSRTATSHICMPHGHQLAHTSETFITISSFSCSSATFCCCANCRRINCMRSSSRS